MTPIDPMLPEPWMVRQVTKETKDTFTLRLEPSDGAKGGFRPGQFSMLWIFGVGEVPVSISGDPGESGHLVYTLRSVGQVTQAVVSRSPGEAIGVRGPFGTAWPLEEARGKDVAVVAGGIGLAPLRGAVYQILSRRQEYGRLLILYGARSPHDVLFRKELAAWSRHANTQVLISVDYGGVSWRGHVGVVTTLFRYVRLLPERTVAMICGPEVMMRFVARELETCGVPPENLYLSMERNMKCAVGFCGHCQWGPHFICKEGPVFPYSRIRPLLHRHEL
jgi:NAD(P)H-flavin reductase